MDPQHRADENDKEAWNHHQQIRYKHLVSQELRPELLQRAEAHKEVMEWVKALVIAALLVFIIRYFLFSPFIVDGASMQPNF